MRCCAWYPRGGVADTRSESWLLWVGAVRDDAADGFQGEWRFYDSHFAARKDAIGVATARDVLHGMVLDFRAEQVAAVILLDENGATDRCDGGIALGDTQYEIIHLSTPEHCQVFLLVGRRRRCRIGACPSCSKVRDSRCAKYRSRHDQKKQDAFFQTFS